MGDNAFLNQGLWFKPQSLQALADAGAWTRGLMLYRSQKVLSLEIEPLNDHWLLLGEVQGSQHEPYEVSIEAALMSDGEVDYWRSECGCPVHNQCKHGVALMVKAAYQGLHLLEIFTGYDPVHSPTAPTPNQVEASRKTREARAQEKALADAESSLLHWLQALDVNTATTHTQSRPEHYLYLLTLLGAHGPTPRLQMEVVISYVKVSGGWAKPKAVKTPPCQGQVVYDQASEEDRAVLQLMRAMPDNARFTYGFNSSVILGGQAGGLVLQKAADTGRLFQDDGNGGAGRGILWGAAQPLEWHWQEIVSPQSTEPSWALRARLRSTQARLCLNSPPLYLDPQQGTCGLVQAGGITPAQLDVLLKAPPFKQSALEKHQSKLMHHLGPLPLPPLLQSLPKLQGLTPNPWLHLSPTAMHDTPLRGLIQAQLRFDYGGHCGWWSGQGTTVMIDDAQGQRLLQRDPEAEFDAISRLLNLGLRAGERGVFGLPAGASQQPWLHWADSQFSALAEAGFKVTLDDALQQWMTHADALDVQLQPKGDEEATSPWFNLSLGIEINGQRHNILPWLPELIAAAAASPVDPDSGLPTIAPFVYLRAPERPGFIRLPTEALKPWMAALWELVGDREHDFSGDSLQLSRLDALRTGAALGEGMIWQGAQTLTDMVQQLRGLTELPNIAVPSSVQARLRPYQQQGLNWLQFMRQHGLGGILADDMGLGKTLQTLTHIQVEKDAGRLTHPALIIAPVSLMGNWQRETTRFCPDLRSLVLHGKARHMVASTMAQCDVVIAPYSLLLRDRKRWLEAQWHLVVLDEAQNIKNASTHAAQVVSQLQTRHRLCLSGTPMENHLGEIWSLFHFLMPGFLGSQARFNELFRVPIERQGNPERSAQLRARITPFMLRRTKAVVAHELPPKIETLMQVELSGKQADLYETIRLGMEKTVREALSSKGLAKSQITILDALLKLRQVCCDPQLLQLDAAKKVTASAKLAQLMTMLPEMLAEGRRILLFSQFTGMLRLIEAELKKCNIPWVKLTGQSQKRDALIEQFTSGQVPLFLISLKAGGVGLNLPQADTVIHYDPWWNPAVEAQATDRAHRIGQTHSVWVIKLVAQGTIEERILALQERKAALADSLYRGATERKQPLFTELDVAELLKPLAT